MSQIVCISGKKQAGKTTCVNYVHGYIMKQNMVVENFQINDLGNLMVTALFKDEDGNYVKNMGVLDVFNKSPEFEQFAQSRIWPLVKAYNFADLLKEACMALFGFSYEQCYGTDEQKNTLTKLRWEDMVGVITPNQFNTVSGPYNESPQEILDVTGLLVKESGFMTAREVMQYFGSNILRKMSPDIWVDSVLRQIEDEQPEVALIGDCRFRNEADKIKAVGGILVRLTRNPYDDQHDSEKDLDDYKGFDLVIDNSNLSIQETNNKLLEFLLDRGIVKPLNLIGS